MCDIVIKKDGSSNIKSFMYEQDDGTHVRYSEKPLEIYIKAFYLEVIEYFTEQEKERVKRQDEQVKKWREEAKRKDNG